MTTSQDEVEAPLLEDPGGCAARRGGGDQTPLGPGTTRRWRGAAQVGHARAGKVPAGVVSTLAGDFREPVHDRPDLVDPSLDRVETLALDVEIVVVARPQVVADEGDVVHDGGERVVHLVGAAHGDLVAPPPTSSEA